MPVAQPPYLSFDPARRRASIDPCEPAFVQDPYAAYAFLHENAPAFFWEEYGFWCFAGYDDVNRLLRDRRFGRENRWGPPGIQDGSRGHLADFDRAELSSLLELEPPAHTRLRALVNRAFVSRQVERLRPRIAALANELIDKIEGDGGADLLPALATPVPITVIAEMLGVPVELGPQLLEWSHRMVEMYTLRADRATEERANEAAREFSDFIRRHAEERRRNPGDDLLSLLIAAREEGEKLNEDELVSSTILLLNAGHEATVHQTGNAIRAILHQGGDPRRFVGSPEATAATAEECLRFDAPLHMFTRFAYEQIEIVEGVTVEPGDRIGLLLGAANRDPASFGAPAAFNPERGDQKNVSFGAGIHFCIGAPLARIELQESLRVLFERLPGIRLAEEPRYRDSYHFHGLEKLDCIW
ncbi:MAG: cytochrome P450 [Rhizobiaceae bacterium]|nr:cytochrome P450 [Rhizobiaceae bacterium]